MFTDQAQVLGAAELWKTKAPNKCRLFAWLVLHGRSWTSERAWRHDLRNDACCAFCDQGVETIDHLLISCPYAREVWLKALRRCEWQSLAPAATDSFTEWWLRSRKRILKVRRKAFDYFVILDGWCLWLERNARVFDGRPSSPTALLDSLWSMVDTWCCAGFVLRSLLDTGIVA
jgi:hypothetical protein